MNDASKPFNYENKIWGSSKVEINPQCLGALRLKYCLEYLKGTKGRVLDIGCGAGGMSKALKFYRPDLDIFGLDVSKKAIIYAKKKPEGVKFTTGDSYHLPYPAESFEAVVMFDVLEHLARPATAIKEVKRVLKGKGLFFAFIPIEASLFSIYGVSKLFHFKPKEKYGGHIQQFTFENLRDLFNKNNLKIAEKKYIGHLFNQISDFSYFTFLYMSRKNTKFSVEGYLESEKLTFKKKLVELIKNTIAVVSYYESLVFRFMPASGVCILASKEQ